MGKTIRISNEVHQIARERARVAGVKLARFIEMAVSEFRPVVTLAKATRDRKAKTAG